MHCVDQLFAFGSATPSDLYSQTSDIDLPVHQDEDPFERGDLLLELWDKMESFFYHKVDLLTNNSINNVVFKKMVNRDKKLIYDRAASYHLRKFQ